MTRERADCLLKAISLHKIAIAANYTLQRKSKECADTQPKEPFPCGTSPRSKITPLQHTSWRLYQPYLCCTLTWWPKDFGLISFYFYITLLRVCSSQSCSWGYGVLLQGWGTCSPSKGPSYNMESPGPVTNEAISSEKPLPAIACSCEGAQGGRPAFLPLLSPSAALTGAGTGLPAGEEGFS